jgi:hypothetical protein
VSHAEIGNLDGATVGCPHEVGRFDVAVDDALKVDWWHTKSEVLYQGRGWATNGTLGRE